MVIVKIKSHRGREYLERALGYKPQYWFSWGRDGNFCKLNDAEYEKACDSSQHVRKGTGKSNVPESALNECHSFG